MSLKDEIELNRKFESQDEALLLSVLYTNQLLERESGSFLKEFALTPIQFNALMIVRDYEKAGINQAELARRLLINRASTGTLLDTLSERALLVRKTVPGDRRAYHLELTGEARSLLKKVLRPYYRRISQVFRPFSGDEKRAFLSFLEQFRRQLKSSG